MTIISTENTAGAAENKARLSALIAPVFYPVHEALKSNRFTHFYLAGGRGSGKSSFVSLEIVLGLMQNRAANAVVFRKVAANLRDSVLSQLLWAIDALGVSELWEATVSPMALCYRPTGQKILLRGNDDPRKTRSVKFKNGACRFIWFEEADEFASAEEIRMINQSLIRGDGAFSVFYTFNPPAMPDEWINRELAAPAKNALIHRSTYLDMPKEWLGQAFLMEAEHLKKHAKERYEHEYLGRPADFEGAVFRNVTLREVPDEEIKTFDKLRRGIDFGFALDPFHYVVLQYDPKRKSICIFREIRLLSLSNARAAELIKAENGQNAPVTADSAEPKSIAELNALGLRVRGAKKGPDSISYGIRFLSSLFEIVIDPARCPHTAREFAGYAIKKDKNGVFHAAYPDRDNHAIDAVRYALELDMLSALPKKEPPRKAPRERSFAPFHKADGVSSDFINYGVSQEI